ncbi:phage tail protein [Paenibacillus sp. FSL E2-8871]|uniref:phage tail-collar fiber domain-containing protein n=1 Tax=Paenibacillus sp. FSL E2-8871 TaxID=2975326 RepID=UPI0030FB4E3D
MAVFGGMTITIKGLALQGKAQAGAKLEYTRVAIGDGSLNGQSMPALNGLISQKMVLPITRIRAQPPNKATIGSVLDNSGVTSGFYFREIGLFATDPDIGEILYAYANSGVTADYIPPGGGSDIIEKVFDIDVVIGTAANISAKIDDSLVFTQKKEFLAHVDNATAHITAAERTAWNTSIPRAEKGAVSGVASLDANADVYDEQIPPNIARKATEITKSATDLNTITTEGEYLCTSNALAVTFLNMPPTKTAFHLKVSKHAGFNQTFTTFNTVATGGDRLRMYTRNFYGSTWGEWVEIENTNSKNVANGYAGVDANVKVPRANTYNSLGGISALSNLDTAYTAGTYSVNANATGTPSSGEYGQVMINVSQGETHNDVNWIWQMFFGTAGNTFVRRKVNNGAWFPWVPTWTGNNDSVLLMTKSALTSGTDFNTLTANGIYSMSTYTGLVNAPSNIEYGVLIVMKTDGASPYVKQEATNVVTGVTQTRFRTGSLTWSAWKTNETTNNKNVAGGYVGLDSVGAINVDKVVAPKVRTGSFFRKYLGSFTTTPDVGNEKLDIIFPDVLSGYVDVVLSSNYGYQPAFGQLRKRFSFHAGDINTGTIHFQETMYVETIGAISTAYAMSDLFYDSASKTFRIRISKLQVSNGNPIQVYIEGMGGTNTFADNFDKATLNSNVITTDSTVYPLPVRTFVKPTTFKDPVTTETGSVRNYAGIQYKYHNVVGYSTTGGLTGTVKITMPKTWSSTMLRIKINGYDYTAGKGAWELTIGAYNYVSTPAWTSANAFAEGNLPFTSVRLAHDGTNNCILLGGLTTVWGITSLEVSEVLASFGGLTGWEKGWQAALITSETGITNVLSPAISYGNANTLNGYTTSTTATPNTVALRDSKGELAGVSSTLVKANDMPIEYSASGITVLEYNVTATDQTLTVSVYLTLLKASNITIYLQYTDPRLGMYDYEICPSKLLARDAHVFVPAFIRAKSGTTVRLYVVHSEETNPAYVTASIGKG